MRGRGGEFSFDRAAKFTAEERFFDVNYLWVPGLRWTVEKLYYTPVRPEFIVFLALLSGITSARFFAEGGYFSSLIGVLFIQLKNFLDTVDGYLARAKGLASRLGRFLDSLADAAVYICLFTGLAISLGESYGALPAFLLSYAAMLSAFLQCSVYNYYLVSYKTRLRGVGINRTDEGFREEETMRQRESLQGRITLMLQWIYQWIYGWQDRFVAAVDRLMLELAAGRACLPRDAVERVWYTDKVFLSLVSPLCFGTQILMLSILTLLGRPEQFLWFVITVGNLYALLILLWKAAKEGKPLRRHPVEGG